VNLSYDLALAADASSGSYDDAQSGQTGLGNSATLVDPAHSGPGPHRDASAFLAGSAQYGTLHATTDVFAEGSLFGPGAGNGQATVNVGFHDVLTATDNNVPSGTHLQYQLTMSLDGVVDATSEAVRHGRTQIRAVSNTSVISTFNANVEDGTGYLSSLVLSQGVCVPTGKGCGPSRKGWKVLPAGSHTIDMALSGLITTTPGARIDIFGTFADGSSAQGAEDEFKCGQSNCFADLSATALADFGQTATFTVVPLTPGASFSAMSGASYLPSSGVPGSSVPEPPSVLLLSTAMLIVAVASWGRRAHRNRLELGAVVPISQATDAGGNGFMERALVG
jgi:hypothetical protein